MDYKTISNAILDYLIENDTTVSDLAAILKVSRGTIYNWMDGKPITKTNYAKLYRIIKDYLEGECYGG